jgi:hypothetical protein
LLSQASEDGRLRCFVPFTHPQVLRPALLAELPLDSTAENLRSVESCRDLRI